MKISVIIPAYNEEKGIAKTIEKIPKEVFEIIVVDNNSTDKTANIAKKLGARVIKETKQGYGYALQKGFREAKGDVIVTLDADGQYPGEKILELVDYFEKNNLDFLNCSRFPLQNKNALSFSRIWGNKFFNFIVKLLFNISLKDSWSGMMIFKKDILKKINLASGDMPLSQELKIKTILAGFKFKETHINYSPREGESKLFPLKHGLITIKFLIDLKNKIGWGWKINSFILLLLLAIYFLLALNNLNKLFINVTSDQNGESGLAVLNWLNIGPLEMKFGKYVNGYLTKDNFDFEKLKNSKEDTFYTHHPMFYLLPTYFLYKIFGISELTTRAGIFLMFIIGIIFFYFALQKIFKNLLLPTIITLIFIFLPGTIHYGTTFELSVFGLPTALITFALFIFYYYSKKNIYLYFLIASIFLGGLMAWFYFFMPASIWFYLLFDKRREFNKERKILLIVLPIVSIFVFALNLLHIYILRSFDGFIDLIEAFKGRAARSSFQSWIRDIYGRMELNFSKVFLWLGVLGFFVYLFNYFKKYKIFLPLLLMPIINTLVFFQWSTHPFGVVFFLPIVAVFNSLLFIYLYEKLKYTGIFVSTLLLIIAFYFSYQKLDFFINKYSILGEKDIMVLKELKNQLKHNEICLGQNQMGLYYGGIAMWYLRKNIQLSPKCLEDENKLKSLKLAIVFHPQLGEFYLSEANNFINKGFKPIGCADVWCLLQK
ncbi:MAG: hypothetical protein KatS3mg097_510 [Candidatus Parcubacteria bacterium]|nr:MAG: hypothetical protein KatS3mg097_510 [Candidatus Parcubacteria bacterium]